MEVCTITHQLDPSPSKPEPCRTTDQVGHLDADLLHLEHFSSICTSSSHQDGISQCHHYLRWCTREQNGASHRQSPETARGSSPCQMNRCGLPILHLGLSCQQQPQCHPPSSGRRRGRVPQQIRFVFLLEVGDVFSLGELSGPQLSPKRKQLRL